ncbi:hypothetical protein CAPTEDRAFT_190994 [Capitella teleta]|uniref:DET1- and DDB1-associated protein 1 n=1 Tax=Capitella teleta TaxID=283909 RepID=R7TK22_CAPTE|nr:hypothetical protein CAPTEDRAFT_190994 [Capitella teleta]|eukprot:ELT93812.1 hypothetical protein CAPTEDRAFT_190994 [Capitella teleta]
MAEFLKGLPSYDEHNFTRFQADSSIKSVGKKPTVYICTTDHPAEQVITTEKANILLRYLHQQWDKKNANKKRDSSKANLDTSGTTSPASKIPRLTGPSDS